MSNDNQEVLLVPKVPSQRFIDGMHPWQKSFFELFDMEIYRFYMLKWHRRSRKTTLAVNLLIRECLTHPNSVYLYVAPTYTQAKNVIWKDPNMLFKWLPDYKLGLWEKNQSDLFIKFDNGSILQLKGSEDPDSIRGIDCVGVVFDEWSLQKYIIWDEIIRPIMTQSRDRWAVFIYTPKQNPFTIDMENRAKDGINNDWYYSKLKSSVSGILSDEELEKERVEHLPGIFEQEMECSDLAAHERVLMTPMMIEDLKEYNHTFNTMKKIVAVDPSLGGDECVIYYLENGELKDESIIHEKSTMVVAGYVDEMCVRHNCKNVIVDSLGIGAGVADRLAERKYYVQSFGSAEKADDTSRFINKRAQAWYDLMNKIIEHKIPRIFDKELIKQLTSIHYEIVDSSGKMKIESKKLIKKSLGYSCDRADCFIYGQYGLDYVEEEGLDRRTKFFNRFRKKYKYTIGSHMSA